MIKAILFDMDGVLVDSEDYYMQEMKKMLQDLGGEAEDEFFFEMIGSPWDYTYDQLRLKCSVSDEVFHKAITAFQNQDLPYDQLIFEDTKTVLNSLKEQGFHLAVCSSSSMAMIQQMIHLCQLENIFDFVISGESLKESKPHPEIYLTAAEALHCRSNECIVIEDSARGIEAGKNADMLVCAIKDTRFGINQSKADYKISHLSALIPLLKQL